MLDWKASIREILGGDAVDSKTLERTIGRLIHAAHIIPHSRYFLNRLRQQLKRSLERGPVSLRRAVKEDLELWLEILEFTATEGVNINNRTFT